MKKCKVLVVRVCVLNLYLITKFENALPFRAARGWRRSRICESKVLLSGWVLGKRQLCCVFV